MGRAEAVDAQQPKESGVAMDYGKLVNGTLQLTSDASPLLGAREAIAKPLGTKAVTYAKIPDFDQATQYVYQTAPVETKGGISVGVAVGTCAVDKEAVTMDAARR